MLQTEEKVSSVTAKASSATTAITTTTTSSNNNSFTMSTNPTETSRRRSIFYVPLTISPTDDGGGSGGGGGSNGAGEGYCENNNNNNHNNNLNNNNNNNKKTLDDRIYNPDLSACSFDWSLDDSINNGDLLVSNEKENKFKRYGIVLNASVNIDDDNNDDKCHQLKSSSSSSSVATMSGGSNMGGGSGGGLHKQSQTSTPIRLMKSRSRNNILAVTGSLMTPPSLITTSTTTVATPTKITYTDKNVITGTTKGVITEIMGKQYLNSLSSPSASAAAGAAIATPAATKCTTSKEKSKTLPQNHQYSPLNQVLPHKGSFLLKSTPRISLNYSSDLGGSGSNINTNNNSNNNLSISSTISPKKSLSFIRRTHSTKLSRSNSLLKSLTSKCVDHSIESLNLHNIPVTELHFDRLNLILKTKDKLRANDLLADIFLIHQKDHLLDSSASNNTTAATKDNSCGAVGATNCSLNDNEEDNAVHSDTSYEKACRRGSAPNTPILGAKPESTSRFTNFFTKRSFRSNPLKRTKSVTKLERSKRGPGGLRGSRSHESLLSNHAVMTTIDLSCTGAVGVAPVHASVLGRRHCFQVRGGPRGERYYSCGSRQERDLWIYSLRKSISPNADNTRRRDNSLKMWIHEAKALPPKKRYFCEINLDKTLYGRTSVKLRTDLLFWGDYFDFPDVPDINVITVSVFREGEKKKKRDKHIFVGYVKIPIREVTSRTFSEDWYPIITEKHDSISKNSSKEPIPTLRIKCRFQSIDILPATVYADFLLYLKANYKKMCEILEPVIGVKAKEDIGQSLVLLMYSQGMAGAFLTDVVALDLLRVGDQRLTFRGNSLATKSMEAFLKLTGEQYLQDTLSAPVSDIITSDRDCEVDPLKANNSLTRQQQALRNAVRIAWTSISESAKHFPPQLRECFATFRERLQMLDREDMADNLISASIFLRFLCPAILTPSLFNITSGLPSDRAIRNLTLVAKTLQTLANFTRFQGKENFMEFLNDFLEQEAPKMKQFLYNISTRSRVPETETILDWPGYIDQSKQLSILHTLLAESLQKLPPNKQQDLAPLGNILDKITNIKETYSFTSSMTSLTSVTTQLFNNSSNPSINLQNQVNPVHQEQYNTNQENLPNSVGSNSNVSKAAAGERGVIRGVLTPSSLEKNIFRYNDPTVLSLLSPHPNYQNQLQPRSYNKSSDSLQYSHSSSSLASNMNNASSMQHHLGSSSHEQGASSNLGIAGSKRVGHNLYPTPLSYYNTASSSMRSGTSYNNNYVLGASVADKNGTGEMRANTLPRNISIHDNADLPGACASSHLIPIGLDPSNAFIRKSPTPLMKSTNQFSGSRSKNLNGSQLSLLSDRSVNRNPCISHADIQISASGYAQPSRIHTTNASNMPLNLEDLDDLLNYADEQNMENKKTKKLQPNCNATNGAIGGIGIGNKGSNISIGQMSHVCSSGYQSIATQSQSSSPIELTSQLNSNGSNMGNMHNLDYSNQPRDMHKYTKSLSSSSRSNTKYKNNPQQALQLQQQQPITASTSVIPPPPLAFKNPLYQKSINSSSLTTSSSEEEHNFMLDGLLSPPQTQVTNGLVASISTTMTNRLNDSFGGLNGRRIGNASNNNNRAPRTNPLMHYKRDEPTDNPSMSYSTREIQRYQRRLSLESARTLSDSSTDTECAIQLPPKDARRRRNMPPSVEQCEREIQRLQASVDSLRHKLEESELKETTGELDTISQQSDNQIRSIIGRLLAMEEELRREQYEMSMALTDKQRVIDAQGQQIAELDAANNELMSALSTLRNRYENPVKGKAPNHNSSENATPEDTSKC